MSFIFKSLYPINFIIICLLKFTIINNFYFWFNPFGYNFINPIIFIC